MFKKISFNIILKVYIFNQFELFQEVLEMITHRNAEEEIVWSFFIKNIITRIVIKCVIKEKLVSKLGGSLMLWNSIKFI